MFTPSSSHLQVVLLLLQSLEAAAVGLTLDGQFRLPLQDVQAKLLAAAKALLHVHRQAGALARRKSLNLILILCFPTRVTFQMVLCVCYFDNYRMNDNKLLMWVVVVLIKIGEQTEKCL